MKTQKIVKMPATTATEAPAPEAPAAPEQPAAPEFVRYRRQPLETALQMLLEASGKQAINSVAINIINSARVED